MWYRFWHVMFIISRLTYYRWYVLSNPRLTFYRWYVLSNPRLTFYRWYVFEGWYGMWYRFWHVMFIISYISTIPLIIHAFYGNFEFFLENFEILKFWEKKFILKSYANFDFVLRILNFWNFEKILIIFVTVISQPDLLCNALALNIELLSEYYRVCRFRDVILEFSTIFPNFKNSKFQKFQNS
jgi:hypothetical protein